MKTARFKIQNLKCHGCSHTISTQLSKLKTVTNVTVDSKTNELSLSYIEDATLLIVKRKLSDLGYPEDGQGNSLPKKTKPYSSCAIGRLRNN